MNNIFIFWENKKPYYIQKCIEKMQEVFKDRLVILNYKNLNKYIPSLPQYLKNINEMALQVDYIRMAVLYYNSGVYIDADCIIFPGMLNTLDEIIKNNPEKDLIGLGKNNVLDANNFLIAPKKNAQTIKKIMDEQERIINGKRGKLYWSEIGGEILQKITSENRDYCLSLNPSPIIMFGWKNTEIFATRNKIEILEILDKIVARKIKGIMLYNKIMKNLYMNDIPTDCLLGYLLKSDIKNR